MVSRHDAPVNRWLYRCNFYLNSEFVMKCEKEYWLDNQIEPEIEYSKSSEVDLNYMKMIVAHVVEQWSIGKIIGNDTECKTVDLCFREGEIGFLGKFLDMNFK